MLARDVIAMAAAGLAARNCRDDAGQDERRYLAPLEAIVSDGRTQAEILLALYEDQWRGEIDPIFTACTF